jgi:hypothetical protein
MPENGWLVTESLWLVTLQPFQIRTFIIDLNAKLVTTQANKNYNGFC